MINRSLGPALPTAQIQALSHRREVHRSDQFELPQAAPPPPHRSESPLPPPNYTRQKWLAATGILTGAMAGGKVGQFLIGSPLFTLPTASLALGAVGGLVGGCLGLYLTSRERETSGLKTVLAGGTVGLALGISSGMLLGGAIAVYGSVASLGIIGAATGLVGAAIVSRKMSTGQG